MDTTISDPLVGQVLDGRYRVDARIARGGMATVYSALDTRLDRIVALKVMHAALAEDEDFVARFNREAKAAARLSHPNVVSVYDQGADAGHVFLVMEYVEGRTLRDLMRERGALTAAQALSVLDPVLLALRAAHAAGIVHRDVKPENVLLADDGRIKVADFGLARAVAASDSTATAGLLIGTVAYLAPEQVERGLADARSDVYAVGVLLYEMVVGRPPYDGETAMAVAFKHVHEDVPAPSAAVSTVPAGIDEIVHAATSRDPTSRPADAGALLTIVQRVRRDLAADDPGVLTDTVVVAPAAGTPPSTETQVLAAPLPGDAALAKRKSSEPGDDAPPRRRRRRRGLIIAAIIVVLALIAGGLGYYFATGQYTNVPSVLTLTVDEAKTKLEDAGLKVKVGDPVFSSTITEGRVVDQDPDPSERIHDGGTVTISPSKGPDHVPDVTGKTVKEATRLIENAQLQVGETNHDYSDDVEQGRVISTSPNIGEAIEPGAKVDLVVSKGPQPVDVPDETGKSESEATSVLEGLGLNVDVAREFSDTVPEGTVIDQDPKSGTVDKGTTVTLTVSKGPELVTVPGLVGMNADDAVDELEGLGLKAQVHRLSGGPNRVLSQDPGSGTQVRKGEKVELYVF